MTPTQVPNYRIEHKIGSGGMGEVFLGRHTELPAQLAAIKIILPQFACLPSYTERFEQEAQAASRVQHEGLVRIYNFGKLADGRPYLVMEHLDGPTLEAALKGGRLPLGEAVELAGQLARALSAVHEQGIVHRDLKPANIILVGAPSGRRAKIVDFGIAKQTTESSPLTTEGKFLGTYQYASPEQCQSAPVNDRSDVYSLGVVVYEMLAGAPLFEGQGLAVACEHIRDPPRPLRDVAPDVPEDLHLLVHQMLGKAPAERPSMAQVAQVLSGLAAGPGLPPHEVELLRRARRRAAEPTQVLRRADAESGEVGGDARASLREQRTAAWSRLVGRPRAVRGRLLLGLVAVLAAVTALQLWLPSARRPVAVTAQPPAARERGPADMAAPGDASRSGVYGHVTLRTAPAERVQVQGPAGMVALRDASRPAIQDPVLKDNVDILHDMIQNAADRAVAQSLRQERSKVQRCLPAGRPVIDVTVVVKITEGRLMESSVEPLTLPVKTSKCIRDVLGRLRFEEDTRVHMRYSFLGLRNAPTDSMPSRRESDGFDWKKM